MRNSAVCLILVSAVLSVSATASPIYTPFLSVDLNGENGTTQTGFNSLNFNRDSGGTSFNGIFNGVSANVSRSSGGINNVQSRNRGNPANEGSTVNNDAVYQDFIFAQRDSALGLGWNALEFTFTGLAANNQYELTFFCFDRCGKTDDQMVMGVVDPKTQYAYQPGQAIPVPILASVSSGGLWPSSPYEHSASFFAAADSAGALKIYLWSNAPTYCNQTGSLCNGFQMGLVPEPATVVLLGIGLILFKKRTY